MFLFCCCCLGFNRCCYVVIAVEYIFVVLILNVVVVVWLVRFGFVCLLGGGGRIPLCCSFEEEVGHYLDVLGLLMLLLYLLRGQSTPPSTAWRTARGT